MDRRLALFVLAVCMIVAAGLAAGCGGPSRDTTANVTEWTLPLSTGSILRVRPTTPAKSVDGCVILLQQPGGDEGDWQPLASRLALSSLMSLGFAPPSPPETQQALEIVSKRIPTPIDKLALVATGSASENALAYAASQPGVKGVVLISPEIAATVDLVGILQRLGKRPLLLVAAEGDSFGSAAARTIKEAAVGLADLRQYPGTGQGTDLLILSESAVEQIVYWLDAVMNERKPLETVDDPS